MNNFQHIKHSENRSVGVSAQLKDFFTRLPAMTNRQVKDIPPAAWARQQAGLQAMLHTTALNFAS
jgi:hypothetical protein